MPTMLEGLTIKRLSLVDRGANPGAEIILLKRLEKDAPKKTEDGKEFPASDYAYVPDESSPSTWKLRLTSTPGGEPDAHIVGAAIAALGEGFRGNKVQIPTGDRAKVKSKVRAAWKKANPDAKDEDLPPVLKADFQEDDMPTIEELGKKIEDMSGEIAKLKTGSELADTISKLSLEISKMDTVEKVDAALVTIGKMADDPRVTALKELAEKRKADMGKANMDAACKDFRSKLSKPMADAFDNMNDNEKKSFMDKFPNGKDDPAKKMFDVLEKSNTDLVAKNAEMAVKIEKIEREEAIRKIKSEDLKGMEGIEKIDEMAESIYKLRKVDKDAADVLLKQMKATLEQAKTAGLFETLGKLRAGDNDLDALIGKKADEIQKREPNLTRDEAIGKAWSENPDLYARHEKEKSSTN